VSSPEPATSVAGPDAAMSESLPPLPIRTLYAALPLIVSSKGVPMTFWNRPVSEILRSGATAWVQTVPARRQVLPRSRLMPWTPARNSMVLVPFAWPSM
jgi:hypothetical protein